MNNDKLQAMLKAFAGTENDFTFPALWGVYRQADPTLVNRGGNIHMYHQILQDPHALSVLRKRASAINAYPWNMQSGSKKARDTAASVAIKEQLSKLRLMEIREEMLLAELVYGFQVGEAMWSRSEVEVVLDDILQRDQIRFNMDDQYRIRLKTLDDMIIGKPVPDRKFIWSTFDRRMNGPYGRGLGSVLWWPVHFKRELQKFWLEYADKFTTPAIVGEAPEGATQEVMDRVFNAAVMLANGSKAAAVPAGSTMKMLESSRPAAETVYNTFIQYLDEEMSKAVLGEAVTSGSSGNAGKAASQVHNDLRKELAISDASRIDTALNTTIVRWLTEFNHPGAKAPRFVTDTKDPVDMKKEAEIVAVNFAAGFRRTKAWMEAKFGGEFEDTQAGATPEQLAATAAASPTGAGSTQVNVNAAAEAKQ